MRSKLVNHAVVVVSYIVAFVVSTLMILDAAKARTYAENYADESKRLTCPPGSKWVQDDASTKTCRDSSGTAHGPKIVTCPGVYDKGLLRRSFFYLNRGMLHGHYKFRDCDARADGDEFEREGYYVNDQRHGMVVWRDITGTIHDSCTYVNDKLDGICIEHIPASPSFASAGFTVKRYYRQQCQYKVETLDSKGRVFRSCDVTACKDEFNCVNTFTGPAKVPALRRLVPETVAGAVIACYAHQPVASSGTTMGRYFTSAFAEVDDQVDVERQSDGTAQANVKVRTRSFGHVDSDNATELTWTEWKATRFVFKRSGSGWILTQCPWR